MNVSDVEYLVKRLYEPNPGSDLDSIQHELQKIQKSPDGWAIANGLLMSNDAQVKFFGALTYKVQLNTTLIIDVESKISDLIRWILVYRDGPLVVTRKLLSAAALMFMKMPDQWSYPFDSIIVTLSLRAAQICRDPNSITFDLITNLSSKDLEAIFLASQIFAEDLTNYEIAKHQKEQDITNFIDCISVRSTDLIKLVFQEKIELELIQPAIDCFKAWALFYPSSSSTNSSLSKGGNVEHITPLLIPLLSSQEEEIRLPVIECFNSILTVEPRFLSKDQQNSISEFLLGTIGEEIVERLVEGSEEPFDNGYFELLLTYGESNIDSIAENLGFDFLSLRYCQLLLKLSTTPGYPIVDESRSSQTVEIWALLAETASDYWDAGDEKNENRTLATRQCLQSVAETYLGKLQLPPLNKFSEWSKDDKENFFAFRRDTAYLYQGLYSILGNPLVDNLFQLLHLLVSSSSSSSEQETGYWEKIEAVLYILGRIDMAPSALESHSNGFLQCVADGLVNRFLQDPCNIRAAVSQSAVDVINVFTGSYFMNPQGGKFIPSTLNYLFSLLSSRGTVAQRAANTISGFCDTGRTSLTEMLPQFILSLESLSSSIDTTAETKLFYAVASVVQAVEDCNLQAEYLSKLLSLLEETTDRVIGLISKNDVSNIQEQERVIEEASHTLQLLGALARGLQSLSEGEEGDKNNQAYRNIIKEREEFWAKSNIRSRTLSIVCRLSLDQDMLRKSGIICEAACCVFKRGLCEVTPGPFVMPWGVIVDFLNAALERGPIGSTIRYLFDLGGRLIKSVSLEYSIQGRDCCRSVLNLFIEKAIKPLGLADPDIFQGILMIMRDITKLYMQDVLNVSNYLPDLMMIGKEALMSSEKLTIADASQFWIGYINKTYRLLEDNEQDKVDSQQILLANLPDLVLILMKQIGGQALRSNLSLYSDVLRRLIAKFPKQTIEQLNLAQDTICTINGVEISKGDVSKFVKTMTLLRGNVASVKTCKEFWLLCRGTDFQYT